MWQLGNHRSKVKKTLNEKVEGAEGSLDEKDPQAGAAGSGAAGGKERSHALFQTAAQGLGTWLPDKSLTLFSGSQPGDLSRNLWNSGEAAPR